MYLYTVHTPLLVVFLSPFTDFILLFISVFAIRLFVLTHLRVSFPVESLFYILSS